MTWKNGNYVKVTSVGPVDRNWGDTISTGRVVRLDLKAGLRTTTLTMSDQAAIYWAPIAYALESLADSGQAGPFWGPDGYRLQVVCRPKTIGCTLTLKRPLLWGTTITFTLGPLPTAQLAPLRAALVRAAGGGPIGAPAWPYKWVQP